MLEFVTGQTVNNSQSVEVVISLDNPNISPMLDRMIQVVIDRIRELGIIRDSSRELVIKRQAKIAEAANLKQREIAERSVPFERMLERVQTVIPGGQSSSSSSSSYSDPSVSAILGSGTASKSATPQTN